MKTTIVLHAGIASLLLLAGCAKTAREGPKKISIAHEKVLIAPLAGLETLAGIEGWPRDSARINALLTALDELHQGIRAEFNRCEKYGMYTVVDSMLAPTVIVRPRLSFEHVRNDTLVMPLVLEIDNRAADKKFSVEIQAYGLFDPHNENGPPLHRIGRALASYRREFPYREAVALFYPDVPASAD
ncbi:MAG: hypothetical protein GF418_15130 [Chitinivibrionales bacterium]|nr:hypothetical protein [Chitinivibrionales bacterium]MBD3396954.1 hypothetical protein [Chitinivibrionales bacterium]